MTDTMTLGERISARRAAHGMSQSELAERLEVSRQSVSKWETDASVPELDKLVKMCDLFEVTLDQLVREKGPGPEQPPRCGRGFTMERVTGLVLLALGVLTAALIIELDPEPILLELSAVLLACGIICLVLPKPGLPCAWALWFGVDLLRYLFTGAGFRILFSPLYYNGEWWADLLFIGGELLALFVLLFLTGRRLWLWYWSTHES